jgi:hypothetical protein
MLAEQVDRPFLRGPPGSKSVASNPTCRETDIRLQISLDKLVERIQRIEKRLELS